MDNLAILIVDPDQSWSSLLSAKLGKQGYFVETAGTDLEAATLLRRTPFPVVLLDPAQAGVSCGETIQRLKSVSAHARYIIVTSRPTPESMMDAVREHLFDYLCKPIDMATLEDAIRRAAEDWRQAAAAQRGAETKAFPLPAPWEELVQESPRETHTVLVGESKAISQVRQQVAEVMRTSMTVLIRGESGTGKGVVARLIHESSPRNSRGSLVKINCPAIPETLLESELFGHEAGAFTDAKGRKPGRFELAHGGTLFLDEIGEIPPNIQVKLLQVIEHKEFQRIGGSSTIRVDARMLAATNASLEQMIAAGQFRADLFYRLNEYCIYLPPLRERIEDIPLLVNHFLRLYAVEFGRRDLALSSETMALFMRCPWYGNVRELESVIRRFALTGREDAIRPLLHPPSGRAGARQESDTLRQSEIQAIMSALVESRWNQRRAAVVLGISYSALRRRIEKYGLKVSSGIRPAALPVAARECRF